tara:strand:- start:111 stop:275 length:165 start_codon:yes stop_codon:yes gene_type:complete
MIKLLQELPADTTIEAAMEQLYLLYKIDRGIDEADRGQVVSHEEARRRIAKWLK